MTLPVAVLRPGEACVRVSLFLVTYVRQETPQRADLDVYAINLLSFVLPLPTFHWHASERCTVVARKNCS